MLEFITFVLQLVFTQVWREAAQEALCFLNRIQTLQVRVTQQSRFTVTGSAKGWIPNVECKICRRTQGSYYLIYSDCTVSYTDI